MSALLLQGCLSGAFGNFYGSGVGAIARAGFCYLIGTPNDELRRALKWMGRSQMLVPLSDAWRDCILADYPNLTRFERTRMHTDPACFGLANLAALRDSLPAGFRIESPTERDYNASGLQIGAGYASFADFQRDGLGYVARDGEGRAVSVACSFVTYNGAIEVDVMTHPEFQRRGLAAACCAQLILECINRNLALRQA